jgi:hypothetical protein
MAASGGANSTGGLLVAMALITPTLGIQAVRSSDPMSNAAATTLLAAQEERWAAADDSNFSFEYPDNWQAKRNAVEGFSEITITDSSGTPRLAVSFDPEFTNQKGILNQCASVDEFLTKIYETRFAPYATGTGQYPYTTVTHDDFKPGQLGGKSTYVTITHVEAYQKPLSVNYYLNAVPRSGGIYLVSWGHPSEPMSVSEPFRQRFLQSIKFKAPPLSSNSYCNYLGK